MVMVEWCLVGLRMFGVGVAYRLLVLWLTNDVTSAYQK